MSKSTEAPQGVETVSSDGMATPYFMLIQMNNASLLEAYATLGISARPAEIKESRFPRGFSALKAISPIPFGAKDKAEHPGHIHETGSDPIKEAEQTTDGSAVGALALGKKVAARFSGNSGSGGDFAALLEAAMSAASLPELDFDPDIFAHGSDAIRNSATTSSVAPAFGGSAPFAGLRPDYRPETAPAARRHEGARVRSAASSHHMVADPKTAHAAATAAILMTRRHHLKGGKV